MGGRAGSGARGGGGGANLQALYEATGGDTRALMEAAGYMGLPKVVDKLDKSKAWEGVELHRGMTSEQFAEQLKSGKMYVGNTTANAYGEGIYSYAGGEAKGKAAGYGSARVVMTLSKSAKVANYEKLAGELSAKGVSKSQISKKISAYAISKGYHAIHVSNGHLHRPDSGKGGLFGTASDVVVVLDRRKLNIQK